MHLDVSSTSIIDDCTRRSLDINVFRFDIVTMLHNDQLPRSLCFVRLTLQAKERQDKEQRQQHGHNQETHAARARRSNQGANDNAENGQTDHEAPATLPLKDGDRR